ncbi:MAG: response regulator [Thermodesulfobacteriota bacterium]|nr:response regulator [Thermodesulfobacteriota bacterium]
MAKINQKHFLEELRFDIRENDLLKARLVLEHLDKVDENIQRKVFVELSSATENFVIPLIAELLSLRPDFGEMFPMLKETLYSKALFGIGVFMNLLIEDSEPGRKSVLIGIAGEMRLEESAPVLIEILNNEDDEKVLKVCIETLGKIGHLSSVSPISEYLYSWNAGLIVAAIRALAQIESPTAFQRLSEKLGVDQDLDLIILKAFASSQSPEALEKLNDTLGSHHANIRIDGKKQLIGIGTKAVPILLKNLLHHDPDLLIHTLNVLGEIGDETAVPAIGKLLYNEPKDPNVRFAAYEALGMLPVGRGAFTLAGGLEDPVANVRSAAAKAIDNNYNMVLSAGLKNIIGEGGSQAEGIIMAIIESQCNKIFLDLIDIDAFSEYATQYLKKQAHPDIHSYFSDLLRENDYNDIAERISRAGAVEAKAGIKVFAVDDSKMILSIYRSVLHNLGCESHLFEFPNEAIERVEVERPDIILTDLNMPDISGIGLTEKVRERFSKEEIPIIMVTTQNDSHDNDAAYAAGVNAIIHKPFDEDHIRSAISVYVDLA